VEEFVSGEVLTQGVPNMMQNLSKELAGRGPQMLAATIGSMDPAMRERITKTLAAAGIDVEALQRGEGGDALAKLMGQRVQALMGQLKNQPPASGGPAPSSGKGASISIDKAWHGVHYLLCGKPEPGADLASQAVMGGTEIGEDLGYGPARYFDAAQVAAIAGELSRPNLEAAMLARFDPDQMANLGIYPGQFVPAEDEEWLMDAFRKLRKFYVDAAAANLAVVTCIE
jgi:hypothetical protein